MEDRGIVICASDLASAIGRHKYRSKDETFRKVWLRLDKESFCLAHSLMFKKEVIQIVLDTASNENLRPQPDLDSDENTAQFVDLMKKIILNNKPGKVFYRIMAFIKGRLFKEEHEVQILADSKVLKQQVAQETKMLCKDEHKLVAKTAKELCLRAGENRKEVIAVVESKLTKDRGTHLESKAIQDLYKAKGIEKEIPEVQDIHYKSMEYEGLKWQICGRIDAQISDDCIVEVKNRKNRFMVPIPDYDYLQLQTYLFLCEKPRGIILERFRGKNKETPFIFDEQSWKEEITPDLARFVAEVCSCMDDYKEDLYGTESPCPSPSPKRKRKDTDDPADEGESSYLLNCSQVPDGREADKENVQTE